MNRLFLFFGILGLCLTCNVIAQEPAVEENDENKGSLFEKAMEAEEKALTDESKNVKNTKEEIEKLDKEVKAKMPVPNKEEFPSLDGGETLPNVDNIKSSLTDEQSKEISQFFDEAAKNYDDILDNRPYAEIETMDNRIDSNQGLLRDHKSKLSDSENILRKVKLEYIRRFLVLKSSYQSKKLDKKTYDRELEKLAKEYEFKVKNMTDDVVHYKDESTKTRERIKALEELNRINKIVHNHNKKMSGRSEEDPRRPLTELERIMQQLQSVGCFEQKNVWDEPDRK